VIVSIHSASRKHYAPVAALASVGSVSRAIELDQVPPSSLAGRVVLGRALPAVAIVVPFDHGVDQHKAEARGAVDACGLGEARKASACVGLESGSG
jgi:hypothetical protein